MIYSFASAVVFVFPTLLLTSESKTIRRKRRNFLSVQSLKEDRILSTSTIQAYFDDGLLRDVFFKPPGRVLGCNHGNLFCGDNGGGIMSFSLPSANGPSSQSQSKAPKTSPPSPSKSAFPSSLTSEPSFLSPSIYEFPTPTIPTFESPFQTIPAPTLEPSSADYECGGSTPSDRFLSLLSHVTPTEILLDLATPQGRAFDWIVNADLALLDPCYQNEDAIQRYVLANFYYSTRGDEWTDNSQWLSESSECLWLGVGCDESNIVTGIELSSNSLHGELPIELSFLKSLVSLTVFDNNIGGSIPIFFKSLKDFAFLDVEINNLTGPVFAELSEPLVIESYRVSFNSLTGTIPDMAFLPMLKEFWAAENYLSGSIPSSISSLSKLKSVFLYNNSLTGIVPGFETVNMTSLQLQSNKFVSTIPDSFYNNENLKELRIDNNMFFGTISTRIGDLIALTDFRVAENILSGSLPAEMARLSLLRTLRVDGNQLEGTIRDAFDNFDDLVFADFSSNLFSGVLPSSIFDAPQIQFLYFNNNSITGSISSNFANGQGLRDLYLHNNILTGIAPTVLQGQLSLLHELRIEGNQISGTMPASICALRGPSNVTDLFILIADCSGNPPPIECDCCSSCSLFV